MKTANISRVLRAEDDQFRAAKNPCDFSKAALRQRKEKDLANARHWVDDFMKDVKEPKSSDFKRLEQFVEVRRKVYEKCYKQIRDKRYAHKQRMDRSGIFARTNTRELAGLVTDLSKLHNVLWHWYRNGVRPRTSRLRGTAGKEIQRTTLKFLRSLLAK